MTKLHLPARISYCAVAQLHAPAEVGAIVGGGGDVGVGVGVDDMLGLGKGFVFI